MVVDQVWSVTWAQVLDEADRLLSLDFEEEINKILRGTLTLSLSLLFPSLCRHLD